MRKISLFIIALVALISVDAAEAQRRVTRVTTVDPVTGVETTEVIRSRGFRGDRFRGDGFRGRGYGWGRARVLGAPVIARRGFPRMPFDGQRIWRAGRQWQFDAALGQWIIIR